MRMVSAEEAHRLLEYPELVAALREAHRTGGVPPTHAHVMKEEGADNMFVSLVAWAPSQAIAVKLVGVFPQNPFRRDPQPSVQGIVALFSGETGAPLLVADGAALTFRKTAADSALGADYLARSDAQVLLVVGAGGLAPHVIAAHRAVRPGIKQILVWNRHYERAQALVAGQRLVGASIEAVRDLDAALPQADIISCVTMATEPLVKGALLKPGAHVDLIGAYRPEMREADDDVARRAGRIFVDTRVNCTNSGEVAEPLARGLIHRDNIVADLFDLCLARHPGRSSAQEITMYKNVGGAHLDLFTTQQLLTRLGAG
jgi:ornithine cyclodeaminase